MGDSINQRTLHMGDVYQDSNNKTRLFRKYNGISGDQLLNPVRKAQEIAEKKILDKIEQISRENSSLVEADQYFRNLMAAVKALSNPSLTERSAKNDAFSSRIVTLSSSPPSLQAENMVLFSPSIGAPEGDISIKVDRIATKDKLTASVIHAASNTHIVSNETRIYIRGKEIKIPSNSTLEEISASINAQKSETNVYSYVRKFSDSDYRLYISSTIEGEKITFQTVLDKLSEPFESQTDPLDLAGTIVIGGEERVITPSMNLTDIAALIGTIPGYSATISGTGPYNLEIATVTSVSLTSVATEESVLSQLSNPIDSQMDPLNLSRKIVIDGEERVITPSMNLTDIAALIGTIPGYSATIGGVGPYTLDIEYGGSPVSLISVATEETVLDQLTDPIASQMDPLDLAGTIVIGGEERVITPSMNLTDIAALIGTIPGYSATIGGSGPYTLEIATVTPVSLTSLATEKLVTQLGLQESAKSEDDLKASFYIDDSVTPILSATNHIEGLYPKTSIDLLAPTQGAVIRGNIEVDKGKIEKAIDDFIEKYNELMKFAKVQTAQDPQNGYKPKEGAHLANNEGFKKAIERLTDMYAKVTEGVSGFNHMSMIGVDKDKEGFLVKNEEKFKEVRKLSSDKIEQIFGFLAKETSGGSFQVLARPDTLPPEIIGKEVKVQVIKNASGEYSAQLDVLDGETVTDSVSIPYGDSEITVLDDGLISIKGPEESIYKGFTFAYIGAAIPTPTAPATSAEEQGFKFSQGIADILTKQLEKTVILPVVSDRLEDQKTDLNRGVFEVNKRQMLEEKKLQELKAKHLRIIQRQERKAEIFQRKMERMQSILNNFQSLMSGFFAK